MPFQMSNDQENDCRKCLQDLQEAQRICEQGSKAGFDMAAQQAACQYWHERLQAILANLGRKRVE